MGHCGTRFFFATGSLVLTGAFITCGISFFGPYWLNNPNNVTEVPPGLTVTYITKNNISLVPLRPYRGLWAQCGSEITWFWENYYELQINMFTPLRWHLAAQVLYFMASSLILVSEIYARVQMCCKERTKIYTSLGIMIIIAAMFQCGALASFGGGASRAPYNAISDPVKIGYIYLDQFKGNPLPGVPYIGWCFWVAVVSGVLSVISGVFFLIAGCCSEIQCCEMQCCALVCCKRI